MVICLERSADLHMAQLMPLPLTVSSFSKIQIGFTFLVPAHLGCPGKRAVKQMCVCVFGLLPTAEGMIQKKTLQTLDVGRPLKDRAFSKHFCYPSTIVNGAEQLCLPIQTCTRTAS